MNRYLKQFFSWTLPITIRGKLLLFVGFSIVILFALMGTINYFGLPFGLYEGEYRKGMAAVIQRLNITADDKKRDIENWFDYHIAGMKICADDPPRMALIKTFASSFRSRTGGLHPPLNPLPSREGKLIHVNPLSGGEGKLSDSSPLRGEGKGEGELLRLPKPDARLEEWLSSVRDTFQYNAIEIVDSNTGFRIFSTEQKQVGRKSPVYGELFGGGADWTDKIFMGIGEAGEKGFLYIAHLERVATDNGASPSPPVVLLFSISMDDPDLIRILHGSELFGQSGEIVLIDMNRRLVAPLKNNLLDGSVARLFEYQLSTKAAEYAAWGIDGTVESIDYSGVPVIASTRHYRITPEFGLGIIVKQDQEEIFAPLKKSLYTSMAIISIGLIALLGILYLMATALLKPLENLSNAVYRIESGDLVARVSVETKDEVGVLAKAFNMMAEKIQNWHEEFEAQVNAQTKEIRTLNTELEQRVIKRTAQLDAANKELEAFSYSVSHDLRAPLRHIDGYVDLLVSRCRDGLNDKGLHYLDTIADSSRQMGVLIDDLLQFSRTGRAEMRKEKMDMNKALKEALTLIQESGAGRTIEWKIPDLPSVEGDYALLRQVWANLLGNAVKYTRTREIAQIEVRVRDEQGEIIFVVADNGVGFDMKYVGKLFGVFQRLHAQEEFEGTGIGLATVQRIINRHGGRVWAEAELDRGAAFYFTLPK